MAKVQTGHSCWGTQCDIDGEQFLFLITEDDAPRVTGVSSGKHSTNFHLEDGSCVEFPDWVLASGETEEEAWEEFWVDHLDEAPESFRLKQRRQRLIRKIENITDPSVIDALEKVVSR